MYVLCDLKIKITLTVYNKTYCTRSIQLLIQLYKQIKVIRTIGTGCITNQRYIPNRATQY